jgi:CRP-like cAMP-binding protein
MNENPQFIRTFAGLANFNTLPTAAYQALARCASRRYFDAGQVIYVEGEVADYLYILETGWVKATRMNRDGREQAMMFLRPVDIFGDIAVLTGSTYPGTTIALERVGVWFIAAQAFWNLVHTTPELAEAVIRHLGKRVLNYISLVEDLSLRTVEARLAHSLLQYAEVQDGLLVIQRRKWTTFDEMAVRLGTVRDVLSRTLKVLEAQNLLKVEKQVIILLDPKGLSELAGK